MSAGTDFTEGTLGQQKMSRDMLTYPVMLTSV